MKKPSSKEIRELINDPTSTKLINYTKYQKQVMNYYRHNEQKVNSHKVLELLHNIELALSNMNN